MKTLSFARGARRAHLGGMFTVLQRMDDATARHTQGGVQAPQRALRPLTLLAAPGVQPLDALEEWAAGQEWIQTLFSSHRRLLSGLHFVFMARDAGLYPRADLGRERLEKAWQDFCRNRLPTDLAAALLQAWRSATDAAELSDFDNHFTMQAAESARSLEAGHLLLARTHAARHQGVLGRYRTLCETGASPGHFIAVWAAVARFFQLSLGTYLTEYLRLEWDTARQCLPCGGHALKLEELACVASSLMRSQPTGLALLDEPISTAPRASSADESHGALP